MFRQLLVMFPPEDVFPWFHLIQWSAEEAKNNQVFRYDLAGAQQKAMELTKDVDSFRRLCPSGLPKDVFRDGGICTTELIQFFWGC